MHEDPDMLILTRYIGQAFFINDDIMIQVLKSHHSGELISLGIKADKTKHNVWRAELKDEETVRSIIQKISHEMPYVRQSPFQENL